MIIVGCDYHPSFQQIVFVSSCPPSQQFDHFLEKRQSQKRQSDNRRLTNSNPVSKMNSPNLASLAIASS